MTDVRTATTQDLDRVSEALGRAFWDDLEADSGRAASFDALMGARLAADAPAVAEAYPWGSLRHVVDVGGGNASLLIAILRAHDDLSGTVIDLAGAVARAEQAIVSAGLGHRADAQVGSFFAALPAGASGYVLSASSTTGMMRMPFASCNGAPTQPRRRERCPAGR